MSGFSSRRRRRLPVALAAVGSSVLCLLAGLALARTFTLRPANGTVRNAAGTTAHARIVVNARGFAVYTLSGDSARHPECTSKNGCFGFWPPVKVASARAASKAAGVAGRLGTWHRNGFFQVTLNGHPLYTFAGDSRRAAATGEGIKTFGGTWHIVRAAGSTQQSAGGSGTGTAQQTQTTQTQTQTTQTQTQTTTTPTTPCAYPPYCY